MVSTKSRLTHGVTGFNWLKAMRILRKKGRLTCIAEEPHNLICSFLSTSKNTPVPFPFHVSVHFTSSEGTTDVPSLNRNVRIRFVVECRGWRLQMGVSVAESLMSFPSPGCWVLL